MNGTTVNTEDESPEHQRLDTLIRELQSETSNADWGYWHFSRLNLAEGESLLEKVQNTLRDIPEYKEPYNVDSSTGSKTYISIRDLVNLKLEPILELRSELISQAEHWSHYQGPSSDRTNNSDQFHQLSVRFADELMAFLLSKEIRRVRLVVGIDTFYCFGGDHTGDDILIETENGAYVVHFGFSS